MLFFLIQLLGDPPGNTVQLHAVELRVIHAFGNKSHKVSDAAGGLQHIAGLKAIFSKALYTASITTGGV